MKRTLLSILSVAALFSGAAAQCSELFISEYVEGSGNNKAIELYNPTASPVNLNNQYRLVRWSNGDATADQNPQLIIDLGVNTIPAYGTFVIVIDKTDPSGTGQDVQADPALQALADTFLCPVYTVSSTMYFNGNDAVSLQKNNGSAWVNIDIFGKIGEDPGVAWTDVFPYSGFGTYITKDHTMVRKSTVTQGITVNPTAFNPMAEYDTLPENTFTELGSHTCDCEVTSVNENAFAANVKIFPNPATQHVIISADKEFTSVFISDVCGREVFSEEMTSSFEHSINISHLEKGIYFVSMKNRNGELFSTRFIKE